jgi:hypothetical protein
MKKGLPLAENGRQPLSFLLVSSNDIMLIKS